MTGTLDEDRISAMEKKLDFIVEELGHLRGIRNSAEDLIADLTLVSKDALVDTSEALGTMQLKPVEVLQLLKTVAQEANLLRAGMQQLASAADFVQDAQPIVRDLYLRAVDGSQRLHDKGYFHAAAAGAQIADALVTSHTSKDWQQVEASVPYLVGFLRELTQPEVLQALQAIIHGFGRVQATMNVNKSIFAILRDLNSEDGRKGIAILTEFLKIVGARSTTVVPLTQSSTQPQ